MGFFKQKRKNELKDVLIRDNDATIKPFSYKKNDMNLAFSVDISNKKKVKDFRELLAAALEDIEKFL